MRALAPILCLALAISACTQADAPATTTTTTRPGPSVVLTDVSELVEQVQDGVVAITVTAVTLDMFLQPTEVEGAGTGFLIDDRGHIVTNAHVVERAQEITVFTRDGEQRTAQVMGIRPEKDLALLRIEDTEGLRPLPLGHSSELEVGDPVVAIGNALGFGPSPTVSAGIVSAKDRTLPTGGGTTLQGLIQTDAAINPGNSGGPLLNARGEVVGINTAIIRGAQNIGFAISIDAARPTLEAFLSGEGEPFLGVSLVSNNPQLARQVGLEVETGAVVVEVLSGSPADRAGLRRGDVILEADGEEIDGAQELVDAIDARSPGDPLTLTVARGPERLTVRATLAGR